MQSADLFALRTPDGRLRMTSIRESEAEVWRTAATSRRNEICRTVEAAAATMRTEGYRVVPVTLTWTADAAQAA